MPCCSKQITDELITGVLRAFWHKMNLNLQKTQKSFFEQKVYVKLEIDNNGVVEKPTAWFL
jgi:hypothetical protein